MHQIKASGEAVRGLEDLAGGMAMLTFAAMIGSAVKVDGKDADSFGKYANTCPNCGQRKGGLL